MSTIYEDAYSEARVKLDHPIIGPDAPPLVDTSRVGFECKVCNIFAHPIWTTGESGQRQRVIELTCPSKLKVQYRYEMYPRVHNANMIQRIHTTRPLTRQTGLLHLPGEVA